MAEPETAAADSYMGFVGVSTAGSSIRRVFPEWADALGLPTRTLIGHDLPVDAPAEAYREVVVAIRDDPRHRGALVTTHKLGVYAAARDLFDTLDETAETFGEISCIAKRDGRLIGSAKDPVTGRLALEEFVPADHFRRAGGAALVLGCGGAGIALAHQLATRTDRPAAITITALDQESSAHAEALHRRARVPDGVISYVVTSAGTPADDLLAALPEHSLVANATGMGKDRPGSPVTDAAVFPRHAIVWEFNYRGPLDFYHQAERQGTERQLRIEDGWRYFVHGWTQAVAEVFDVAMPADTVDELGRIAARMR